MQNFHISFVNCYFLPVSDLSHLSRWKWRICADTFICWLNALWRMKQRILCFGCYQAIWEELTSLNEFPEQKRHLTLSSVVNTKFMEIMKLALSFDGWISSLNSVVTLRRAQSLIKNSKLILLIMCHSSRPMIT